MTDIGTSRYRSIQIRIIIDTSTILFQITSYLDFFSINKSYRVRIIYVRILNIYEFI
jgi:hypothetical protein